MKSLYATLLFITILNTLNAQIDLQCNGRDKHAVYIRQGGNFYRIDNVDTDNPSDLVLVAQDTVGLGGISINKDLENGSGEILLYGNKTSNGMYYYWNGTNWINTGHSTGSTGALHPGGSTEYIFNLDADNDQVYRYDGITDAVLIMGSLGTALKSVYDIAVDKAGNFYVFYTTDHKIVCYNVNGVPLDTIATTGNPIDGQPGFAILGNNMYIIGYNGFLYKGTKTGNTMAFVELKAFPSSPSFTDMAACPEAGEVLAVFKNPGAPHFAVYPNPANDVAVIRMHNTESIMVTDYLGRIIMTETTNGKTEYKISINGWTRGIYFLTATASNGQTACNKFIVD